MITFTGRKVPEFLGVRGSIRYAKAMCTADIVLGKAEFTNPVTWGAEALRSITSPSPFFVTVARIGMFVTPWPSSSRIEAPRYTPSRQVFTHARAWRSAPSRISSTAPTTVLAPYCSTSASSRRSPTRAEPIIARRSPMKSCG